MSGGDVRPARTLEDLHGVRSALAPGGDGARRIHEVAETCVNATRALADGRINITTVYGTSLTGNTCRILVAVENVVKAKSVLDEAAAKA